MKTTLSRFLSSLVLSYPPGAMDTASSVRLLAMVRARAQGETRGVQIHRISGKKSRISSCVAIRLDSGDRFIDIRCPRSEDSIVCAVWTKGRKGSAPQRSEAGGSACRVFAREGTAGVTDILESESCGYARSVQAGRGGPFGIGSYPQCQA